MLKRFIAWLELQDSQGNDVIIALIWAATAMVLLLGVYAMNS